MTARSPATPAATDACADHHARQEPTMRPPHPARLLAVPAVLFVFSLASACGGGQVAAGPAPTTATAPAAATPSTTAPLPIPPPASPTAPPAPTAAPAELDVEQVATRYLAARENAISYTHPQARSWLDEVRPVMTPAGWQQLAASLGDNGGYPAATARQHRWSVRVMVTCRTNPDAGPATATDTTLTCELSDRTIDAAGVAVPVKALPALWPYNGAQPPALLALHRQAGQWLVSADQTGQAG